MKDVNQEAYDVVAKATGGEPSAQKATPSPELSKVRAINGSKGGKRRLETMTPEERSERAKIAIGKRWPESGREPNNPDKS